MTEQKATNVFWHDGDVNREDRARLLKQKGVTLWFTGLSGSGKSTIAVALEQALMKEGKLTYRLDGDNIRMGINKNLGFGADDRTENIRRIGEISKLFVDVGVITLSSFVSPYRADRDIVRELHEQADMDFIEVYVEVPLEVAEERDTKGLYKKARAGEIPNFTGISDPYEAPENAEVVLHTDKMTLDEEVEYLMNMLRERGLLDA